MSKLIPLTALGLAMLGGAASAHMTDDPDAPSHYSGYDCTAMAGTYAAGASGEVRVDVSDANVVFTAKGRGAVVGECIAPLVKDGAIHPSASVEFDTHFAEPLQAEGCCVAVLKDDAITFEKTGDVWSRVSQ